MNGSGCRNCPVKPCETMNYRGSTCSAQRAKFGLGDPDTNADRIRSMTDEELAILICKAYECYRCPGEELCNCVEGKANGAMKWLQQPAEVVCLGIDTRYSFRRRIRRWQMKNG